VKTESNGDGRMAAAANPYLAHWNDEKPVKSEYSSIRSGLQGFKRHVAEDGPNNVFTGRPLSSKYMSILHKRRDLPLPEIFLAVLMRQRY
jgi:pre-mRNA-splicing factor ATP-dependent RNA helicase DHX15/PRP43